MSAPPPGRAFVRLGPRQEQAVAVAVTLLATAVIAGAVIGGGWLATWFLTRFSNVFLPLAAGGVAALVFRPYYRWLNETLRMPTALAIAALLLSIFVPLGLCVWFFGAMILDQLSQLVIRLPVWWSAALEELRARWPEMQRFFQEDPWGMRLRQIAEGQVDALLHGLQLMGDKAMSFGAFLARITGALLAWAVFPVYFVFFLLAKPRRQYDAERVLPFLKPETRKDVAYLAGEFVNIVVAFFRGQLVVALLMGLLFAIGFSIIGLRYGFVLGLLLGFLNIIPYLGSVIGLAVCLPLAWFQEGGGLSFVGLVILVFTIVQTIEGYLLTPRIMNQRTGLHPIAIIFAIFFWGSALNGILGMVLAIPFTAFLVVLWRLLREKYVRELV